jgi:hypothetical protein
MPDTQVAPNQKPVLAKLPNGKMKYFKAGSTREQILTWYKGQNTKAPVKKEETKKQTNEGPDVDPEKLKESMFHGLSTKEGLEHTAIDQLPNAGMIGGEYVGGILGTGAEPGGGTMVGKNIGAGIGAGIGEGVKELANRMLFNESRPTKKLVRDILVQAVEGAGISKAGEYVGSAFLKLAAKIPHSAVKDGIPLLPSDIDGGKMKRYMEQLLTNLLPSAGVMKEFTEKQASAITKGGETIANAMSKFKGTPEQFGILLQDSVNAAKKAVINKIAPQLSKLAPEKAAALQDKVLKPFYQGLLGQIAKSRNVEQLSGLLVSKGIGNEEIRNLMKLFSGTDQFATIQAARTRIMHDVLEITMRGTKDPTLKRMASMEERFLGKQFTKALDNIGEERLKTIFTEKQFESISKFQNLISRVAGDQSSFVGRFMNLAFILGPFRGSFSVKGMTKLGMEAGVLNTLARVITSEKGVQAVESYVRATGAALPKSIKIATDGLKTEFENAHREYLLEQKYIEEQQKKEANVK